MSIKLLRGGGKMEEDGGWGGREKEINSPIISILENDDKI